jgi:hypothetical protein
MGGESNYRLPPEYVPATLHSYRGGDGPRLPAYGDSQKGFAMRFYLLHPPGREADAAMLARAIRLARRLKEF